MTYKIKYSRKEKKEQKEQKKNKSLNQNTGHWIDTREVYVFI